MKESKFASINSIESAGMVDGPGIRTVIFFNGCYLRCKYCHNPETWIMTNPQFSKDELLRKILKNKAYFASGGGVTFSGGEPLLQSDFLYELSKDLKKENIHIALDTAGVSNTNYEKLLPLLDLVILDIKHVDKSIYKDLTGYDIMKSLEFINLVKKHNINLWIRQVIIPGLTDLKEYINEFYEFIKDIPNILKVEFIPYHDYGKNKYDTLGLKYEYYDKKAVSEEVVNKLFHYYENLRKDAEK